jgi:hypothetical protein
VAIVFVQLSRVYSVTAFVSVGSNPMLTYLDDITSQIN